MTETNVKTSMVLPVDFAELYSQVDGLSLQNLFYVKNNAKKPTFMYAYSALFQEIS